MYRLPVQSVSNPTCLHSSFTFLILTTESNPVHVSVTNSSTAYGTNPGSTDVLSGRPSFQQLSSSEQEELKAMLDDDVRKMKYLFGCLVTKTHDSVEKRIPVGTLATSILALGAYEPAREVDKLQTCSKKLHSAKRKF